MPSYTVTANDSNAARIIAALRRKHPQKDALTDRALFGWDLERYFIATVLTDERAQAGKAVAADLDLTEVT